MVSRNRPWRLQLLSFSLTHTNTHLDYNSVLFGNLKLFALINNIYIYIYLEIHVYVVFLLVLLIWLTKKEEEEYFNTIHKRTFIYIQKSLFWWILHGNQPLSLSERNFSTVFFNHFSHFFFSMVILELNFFFFNPQILRVCALLMF